MLRPIKRLFDPHTVAGEFYPGMKQLLIVDADVKIRVGGLPSPNTRFLSERYGLISKEVRSVGSAR